MTTARIEWFLPKGDGGFEGTVPYSGQHYELRMVWAADGDAEVWLDGKPLRRFATGGEAWNFVSDLVKSENDRAEWEWELETPAEIAALVAAELSDIPRLRMTRPWMFGKSTEHFVHRMCDAWGGETEIPLLMLPLMTEPVAAKALRAWLAEKGAI